MTRLRAEKIAGIASDIGELEVDDPDGAELLVLGWGSTYGAIKGAVRRRAAPRARRSPPRICTTSTRCRPTPAMWCAPIPRS